MQPSIYIIVLQTLFLIILYYIFLQIFRKWNDKRKQRNKYQVHPKFSIHHRHPYQVDSIGKNNYTSIQYGGYQDNVNVVNDGVCNGDVVHGVAHHPQCDGVLYSFENQCFCIISNAQCTSRDLKHTFDSFLLSMKRCQHPLNIPKNHENVLHDHQDSSSSSSLHEDTKINDIDINDIDVNDDDDMNDDDMNDIDMNDDDINDDSGIKFGIDDVNNMNGHGIEIDKHDSIETNDNNHVENEKDSNHDIDNHSSDEYLKANQSESKVISEDDVKMKNDDKMENEKNVKDEILEQNPVKTNEEKTKNETDIKVYASSLKESNWNMNLIKTFHVSKCPKFSSIPKRLIKNLSSCMITSLILSENRITSIPSNISDLCPSLAKLDLKNNLLRNLPYNLSKLFLMKHFVYLNVQHNYIELDQLPMELKTRRNAYSHVTKYWNNQHVAQLILYDDDIQNEKLKSQFKVFEMNERDDVKSIEDAAQLEDKKSNDALIQTDVGRKNTSDKDQFRDDTTVTSATSTSSASNSHGYSNSVSSWDRSDAGSDLSKYDCYGYERDTGFEDHVDMKKTNIALYLGSALAAKNKQFLREKNIGFILSVCNVQPFYPREFQYKIVKEEDMEHSNLLQHFHSCIEFIETGMKKGKSVLIHCAAGISRSTTIVIMYVMNRFEWGFQKAYDFVRFRRCCVVPNNGFQNQLRLFHSIGYRFEGESYKQFINHKIVTLLEEYEAAQSSETEEACAKGPELNLSYLKMKKLPESLINHPTIPWSSWKLLFNHLTDASFSLLSEKSVDIRFKFFDSLRIVELQHNNLQSIPNALCYLNHLEVLKLSHNNINHISKQFLTSMGQYGTLSTLHLNNNQIEELPDTFSGNLSGCLTILDISFNRISELPSIEDMVQFQKLKLLNLFENPLQANSLLTVDKMRAQSKCKVRFLE